MIQREPMQKAAFLRDLPAMCAQFDARVLRYQARSGWGGQPRLGRPQAGC